MSIEQMAELIGEGRTELTEGLWENTRRFFFMLADRYARRYRDRLSVCGLSSEDLKQEAYIVFMNTLGAYKSERGYKFLTYADLQAQRHYNEVLGFRTRRGEPLNSRIVPLDEVSPQPTIEKSFDTIEGDSYRRVFWRIVRDALTAEEWQIVKLTYIEDKPPHKVQAALGLSKYQLIKRKKYLLAKLRISPELNELLCDVGYHTAYRRGSIERLVERREHLKEIRQKSAHRAEQQ